MEEDGGRCTTLDILQTPTTRRETPEKFSGGKKKITSCVRKMPEENYSGTNVVEVSK